MLSSSYHRHFSATHDRYLGFESHSEVESRQTERTSVSSSDVDTTAPLFQHIATILFALHLVYQVALLNTRSIENFLI